MRFGVNILNFGAVTDPEALVGWASFAEKTGYHFAMISDHVAVTPDVAEQYPAPFYDPFATLAWLAGRTSRIELGTSVTVLPYRHPLLTARMAANIDRFSEGRLFLGVGVSWPRREFAALGVPFHRRGSMTDEYLRVIKRAWTEDVISMEGEHVSFEEVATGPAPVRKPHPPIWVGGSSAAAIRRAVRFGDAWHPINPTLNWLRETGLPGLRNAADREGLPRPRFAPRIRLELTDRPLADRRLGEGTTEQVHEDLAALAALGAESVLFDTYAGRPSEQRRPSADWEMLDVLARQVVDVESGTLR